MQSFHQDCRAAIAGRRTPLRERPGRHSVALLAMTLWLASVMPRAAAPDELMVGDVSSLDLSHVRSLIEGMDPARLPSASIPEPHEVPGEVITLDEALRVALRANLALQIITLDRDATAREIPATRAKFHPTPVVEFLTEQARTVNPLFLDENGNFTTSNSTETIRTQAAAAFVRQEVPTGALVAVGTDLFREDFVGGDLRNEAVLFVELRQPLMRGGRTVVARREILDAGYDLEVEEARLEAEILGVVRDTKVAYYNTILAARLIDVTEEAVVRDRQLIDASEALFDASRATRRDVVSAQIRLADDLARLAARRAEFQRSQLALRDVLGASLERPLQPAEAAVPFRRVEFRLEEWIAHAVAHRPELRGIRSRLDKAELSVRVASNDVLPTLDLVGRYERRDEDESLVRSYDSASEGWIAGLQFSVPFGSVAARQRLTAREIEHARIGRELESRVREIEREVRDEEIQIRRNLSDLRAQATKVEKARAKLEISVARYQLGIANNLDVTDAQEDLLDAETDLLTAVVDYTNGLARLEASIAGTI